MSKLTEKNKQVMSFLDKLQLQTKNRGSACRLFIANLPGTLQGRSIFPIKKGK